MTGRAALTFAAAIPLAAGVAAFAGTVIGGMLRRVHHCEADPDLSALIGAPACRCGRFFFGDGPPPRALRVADYYRRRCNEEDSL